MQSASVDVGWEMTTPDLQALIELLSGCRNLLNTLRTVSGSKGSTVYSCIESRGGSLVNVESTIKELDDAIANHSTLTAPTLPGAGGGNALDARRYRWLRANAYEGRMESRGPNPDFALNCDEPESEWDAAIDAAMTPQQGG